jgi:hypothetical protein
MCSQEHIESFKTFEAKQILTGFSLLSNNETKNLDNKNQNLSQTSVNRIDVSGGGDELEANEKLLIAT